MDEKTALRQEIKKTLALLTPEQFRKAGAAAAELVRSSPCWRQYKTVCLFMSNSTEIYTLPLVKGGLTDGKNIFLPRVMGKKILFYRISAEYLEQRKTWPRGSFGIREPDPAINGTLEPGDFPALILTPGMAFDQKGNRLGHGAGYYDRFFAGLDRQVKTNYLAAGLCLEA
ncbi:MAG: 5-formyltetrahydrofolate cyclo-ligase, partial [Treponema sp.]|nr:5-formyltetrahydrofolate cyclo-ligase [Treponema sp.]